MKQAFQFNPSVSSDDIIPLKISNDVEFVVMIPTYKRIDTLKEAVESCIAQGLGHSLAVIIVDNSSEGDDALDLFVKSIESKNIALVRNSENLGMIGNWNRCIELSPLDRLIILHDDDLLEPGSITELYRYGHNNQALISGAFSLFGRSASRGRNLTLKLMNNFNVRFRKNNSNPSNYYYHELLQNCPVYASSLCLDKSSSLAIGGYFESKWPVTDYDFCLRYILRYGMIRLNKLVLRYRVELNASSNESLYMGVPGAEYNLTMSVLDVMGLNYIQLRMAKVALKLRAQRALREANRFRRSLDHQQRFLNKGLFYFERISVNVLIFLILRIGLWFKKPDKNIDSARKL